MREEFARDVVLLKYVGLNPIVVHGGGPDITSYMERLGLPVHFVAVCACPTRPRSRSQRWCSSARSTRKSSCASAATASPPSACVATTVRCFGSRGGRSRWRGHWFVGQIERVNVDVLHHVALDYIPVIASVGSDREGNSYNVNADEAAGAVAGALGAYKVVFLTDVAGWLADPKDPASLIGQASAGEVEAQLDGLQGGMRPKLAACVRCDQRRCQLRSHHRRTYPSFAIAGAFRRMAEIGTKIDAARHMTLWRRCTGD